MTDTTTTRSATHAPRARTGRPPIGPRMDGFHVQQDDAAWIEEWARRHGLVRGNGTVRHADVMRLIVAQHRATHEQAQP